MIEQQPEILHTQQGLVIRRNPRNKFVVARLHYTADKVKRSAEWKAEAMSGLSEPKFRKEYEIDYTALFGEKVFPQFEAHKDRIVVQPPYPEVTKGQMCWAGLDYGVRNPTAFEVFTMRKNAEGDMCVFAIWEHYEPTKDVATLAEKMLACPYYDRIKWIAADPHSLWAQNISVPGRGMTTIAQQLTDHGIKHKLLPATQDEEQWVTMMNAHWGRLEEREPTFKILDCCPNLIHEVERAIYQRQPSTAEEARRNAKERIQDIRNHAMDATKYFMNMAPKPRPLKEKREESASAKPAWSRYRYPVLSR